MTTTDSFNRPDARCPCTDAHSCTWPGFHCSVMTILNMLPAIQSRSMSGAFNDMDMLEVGNAGQTDAEYIVHFSMWALNSSPLLIGTNMLALSPASLSILANPAVIALNQDPSAAAAIRVWRADVPETDDTGQGEISLWTRVLDNGDTALALLNAGNVSRVMQARAADLFLDQGTAGTYGPAAEMDFAWDVYDLWANRMPYAEAARALNGTGEGGGALAVGTNATVTRYNATRMSYAEGLRKNAPALFGAKVGTLAPGGTWRATVDRHSVGLFRLRRAAGVRRRDEL
jgi:alpha-galactosidase